ncbi:conserved Plasmodium protein, unknown function [Plasmodium knowlesi strain H]|uniref:Centrosomal protein of 70 kDa n=2 Tax=Plasmodium knowlesi TaxID=5850 RepID=B3LA17_PLAKH|nr:conserved Plasmodium protein, unknown function [Plasmodium knowlesi strain H]OTN65591.1 Uncharacterized protein PKNOH_S110113200 [Plasmodium knowlesi]CAA9989750.1 conserved Plasmodium protein, unknown function [Plasmodium knowlesi strain H]VVS79224.1 conserved Plasmodium protein, unknown function [Plasmodium knowlesi strain H]|eukprot:XP_002260473.1 hypothetical protein, conserved in Plasmodium species [Plasmodium knowlesi strain H]
MSDDEFFQDKGSSSLQYIKCKTSTKIDDILKRRRNKLTNGENGDGSRGGSPNEVSSPKYNPSAGKEKEHHIEGSKNVDDERYSKWGEKSDSEDRRSSYHLEDVNKYLTKHSHAGVLDDEGELKIGRNYTQHSYSLEKKNFANDSVKDIYSYDEKLKKENIKSCINFSTCNDTKRSQLAASKSMDHLNLQGGEKNGIPYYQHNGEETGSYTEDILGGKINNIYKTPSTEVLLREIKSKGHEDENVLHNGKDIQGEYDKSYDENMEDIFANLNNIYLNDVDLNKTPSKSFSRSYFEYLKFETAGKMNMSELETPANLKDEKDDEGANTPFITYYLAGKTSKNGLEEEVNLEHSCNDEKISGNDYLPRTEEPHIIEQLASKGEEGNAVDSHFVTEEEVGDVSHLDRFKSIIVNQNDDTKYRRSYNGGGECGSLLKLASSKKYNFIKTEEEYKDILREKNGEQEIPKRSGSTSGRIPQNGKVDVLEKMIENNNVSFNDSIFLSNQFHIMNTKSFRENLFVNTRERDRESTVPLQVGKNTSDALPPGSEMRRSFILRENTDLANSLMDKPGVYTFSQGEEALKRGDPNYGSLWNGNVDPQDDKSFGVSKNNLMVDSMMVDKYQTGIKEMDEFAIHRSGTFGDIKKSINLTSKLDKVLHTDVHISEYSKGGDKAPFRFNSLKRSTVNLTNQEEDNHSRNASEFREANKNISYNSGRSYNNMNDLDAEGGRLADRNDVSNPKNGIDFTKFRNLQKHSQDGSNGLLHNTHKYSVEGREKKNFSNCFENAYLRSSHYIDDGERMSSYANDVRKKKNITVDIGGVNKHTRDSVGFMEINNPHELQSFGHAQMEPSEKGSLMYRNVVNSNSSNVIIPTDVMTNEQLSERHGMSFYSGPLVERELIIPMDKRGSVNKLGETADFGGKESSELSESRNNDNTVRIISSEGYIPDKRREIIDGRDLREYWFDYINSSLGSVNANDIRGLIFCNSQGCINNSATNKKHMMGPTSNQTQKSTCAVPGDVSNNRISEDTLAELIREKIKCSINDVVEKLLSQGKSLDIVRKELLKEVEKEPSLSHTPEGYYKKGHCSSGVKCDQGGADEDFSPVETVENELTGKKNDLICNKEVSGTTREAVRGEVDQEKGSMKIVRCTEEHVEGDNSERSRERMRTISNKETVHLDEEDMEEIEKLNNHLKLNKIKKSVNLQKEDEERNEVKWKNLLYNCIDIIYLLTNENNAKNKKMNSLLGEINKLNEYEKKIEILNEENEKLKVQVLQKNELVKKRDIKERTNLNIKIAEQAKKIANYEKDINIYKNKINKLNNKISNKESELDKLKNKYQVILDETEKCKQDATTTLKQVLNKKHTTLVDKQCLDISKYYEVEMCMLNKQIKNLKDLLKSETKEKIMLSKKLSECSEESTQGGQSKVQYKAHSKANSYAHSSDDEDGEERGREAAPQKGGPTQGGTREQTNEGTYKKMCQNLFNEMNEIKKNFDNQKILYDQKIEQLEQKQELQNIKNKLDASEKIVEVYQNIFRENVNYIKSDNLQKRDLSQPMVEMHPQGDGKSYSHHLQSHEKDNSNSQMNAPLTSCNIPGVSAEFTMSSLQMGSESGGGHLLSPGVNSAAWGSVVPSVSGNNMAGSIGMASGLVSGNAYNMNTSTHHNYLNEFVKMYLEKNPISESNNGFKISDFTKWNEKCTENRPNIEYKIKHLHESLMKIDKTELVNIFINICSELKIENIFFVIHFIKFLSFIVYEQFPLFTSFFYKMASIISINSRKFDEYIDVIKKWKRHYVNGEKYYLFRKNVLLIFQANLKDVKKSDMDRVCLNLVRSLYQKNLEMSKYSNESFEKAEYILNKHSKEIISKIIKTYMNLYNIDKISNIIPHMNSMNSKLKTQSYFVRSISSCLNLSKTDNFQEIEQKIKELAATKGINEKIKNRINVDEMDEYLAAYTIMGTLKKYLNVTLTQDLLPSISKIIQKNRSSQ